MRRIAPYRLVAALPILLLSQPASLEAQPPGAEKILPVRLIPQEETCWCWAACGEMIMTFHDPARAREFRQCQQATDRGCGVNCCANAAGCNKPGWPDFRYYGFRFRATIASPLEWKDVVSEINAGRPFCFTQQRKKTRHMLVVKGYYVDNGNQRWVIVNEPLARIGTPDVYLWYEDYRERPHGNPAYAHGDDFYEIK